MNTFSIKGVVSNNKGTKLIVSVDEETILAIDYVSASQIDIGSRVEVDGHLQDVQTEHGRYVQAIAEVVNVQQQLVLGAADEIINTLDDATIDGDLDLIDDADPTLDGPIEDL